ncbi:MAG: T9SS type A sorting domain-containing protein [Bacteroidales bacterium]|nr:T9SS type A sorting domain-containing protein [Bacteroidales bacterium]MBN2819953.1 T9SS type A sorting domain-containing protein [Bacteroidales bacterium]
MKQKLLLPLVFATLIISVSGFSQGYHVRIGTIGNSITHGIGLPNPETDAYPAQLGEIIKDIYGDTCIVKNFGLTTTTMLKHGDTPYWKTQHLKDYIAYAPEICFILLGTNDTKPYNWDVYGDEFIDDYLAMIDTIKQRNPSTKFMLGYPPPAYEIVWEIRDSIIVNHIIPAIDSILKLVDAELVDFYHPLLDSVHLFPDNIHPNVDGARVLAEMILEQIVETDIIHQADTGLTFVTSFSTSVSKLKSGSTAELSWTSINADSLYLNGKKVDNDGSLRVQPQETTTYILIAYGEKQNDTVSVEQVVYVPELTSIKIYPTKSLKNVGDTVFIQTKYYDQANILITDQYFNVQWQIIEGSGTLYNPTDTAVSFICVSSDTTTIAATYNQASDTSVIYILPGSEVVSSVFDDIFSVYPNPAKETLSVEIQATITGNARLTVFDTKASLVYQTGFTLTNPEKHIEYLNLNSFDPGLYIINLEYNGLVYTRKFNIVK